MRRRVWRFRRNEKCYELRVAGYELGVAVLRSFIIRFQNLFSSMVKRMRAFWVPGGALLVLSF